jgi:HD-GYP domain-containing protein (c-di-GMP phosphodiesterase class II)
VADLEGAFTTTLAALTSTVEAKDDYTACHGEDVAGLAERVALRMSLGSTDVRDVRYAAMLHDIGKIAVPSEILLKPGPLNDEEWAAMRRHSAVGGELVGRIDAFAHLAPVVRACHERWDGDGYPDGLAGDEIPLAARIIAVCDTYDAIVTDRPYRPGRAREEAYAELLRVAGAQLDARLVDVVIAELGAD